MTLDERINEIVLKAIPIKQRDCPVERRRKEYLREQTKERIKELFNDPQPVR